MLPGDPSKIDLNDIGEASAAPEFADPKTSLEDSYVETKKQVKKAHLELDLDERIERNQQRRDYAKATFVVVLGWLLAVLLIVLLQGFGALAIPLAGVFKFQLDNSVLVALVATSTANIIGILLVVLNFIFPVKKG